MEKDHNQNKPNVTQPKKYPIINANPHPHYIHHLTEPEFNKKNLHFDFVHHPQFKKKNRTLKSTTTNHDENRRVKKISLVQNFNTKSLISDEIKQQNFVNNKNREVKNTTSNTFLSYTKNYQNGLNHNINKNINKNGNHTTTVHSTIQNKTQNSQNNNNKNLGNNTKNDFLANLQSLNCLNKPFHDVDEIRCVGEKVKEGQVVQNEILDHGQKMMVTTMNLGRTGTDQDELYDEDRIEYKQNNTTKKKNEEVVVNQNFGKQEKRVVNSTYQNYTRNYQNPFMNKYSNNPLNTKYGQNPLNHRNTYNTTTKQTQIVTKPSQIVTKTQQNPKPSQMDMQKNSNSLANLESLNCLNKPFHDVDEIRCVGEKVKEGQVVQNEILDHGQKMIVTTMNIGKTGTHQDELGDEERMEWKDIAKVKKGDNEFKNATTGGGGQKPKRNRGNPNVNIIEGMDDEEDNNRGGNRLNIIEKEPVNNNRGRLNIIETEPVDYFNGGGVDYFSNNNRKVNSSVGLEQEKGLKFTPKQPELIKSKEQTRCIHDDIVKEYGGPYINKDINNRSFPKPSISTQPKKISPIKKNNKSEKTLQLLKRTSTMGYSQSEAKLPLHKAKTYNTESGRKTSFREYYTPLKSQNHDGINYNVVRKNGGEKRELRMSRTNLMFSNTFDDKVRGFEEVRRDNKELKERFKGAILAKDSSKFQVFRFNLQNSLKKH